MDEASSPIYRKFQILVQANEKVLDSARQKGDLREGVDAREVMRVVSGIATVVDRSGITTDDAGPMLAIGLDGILDD